LSVLFGCALGDHHAPELVGSSLLKASFVGHDSTGIGAVVEEGLAIRKEAVRVGDFLASADLSGLRARACVGHLRWATHGVPHVANAHPLTDCGSEVAVVHNGIIENAAALRGELMSRGHEMASKTDSEVLAHLVEEGLSSGLDLLKAVSRALALVEGSVASAFIYASEPEVVVCACSNSRLYVAHGPRGSFCSSELCCLHGLADSYVEVGGGELAILRPGGFEVLRADDLSPLEKEGRPMPAGLEEARREGHEHMVLREIWEQVRKLPDSLRLQGTYLDLMASMLADSEELFLVGSGSSYNACLAASYLFSSVAYRAAHAIRLEDFIEHYGDTLSTTTTILVVDDVGGGRAVEEVIGLARRRGATVLGITNTLGSFLTRMARVYLCQHSGPPLGVVSMRSFTAQVLVLAQLAVRIAELRGKIGHVELEEAHEALSSAPSLIGRALELSAGPAKRVAKEQAGKPFFFVLGRGIGYPTALEGVQKLAEVAGIAGLSYPAGESKHGPISLVEEGFPVIFVCQKDETHDDIIGNIMEMKARGAHVVCVAEEGDEEVGELADDLLPVPDETPQILTPVIYVAPLQLLAYYGALARGIDPDVKTALRPSEL